MFLSNCTRPDLSYAVNYASRFASDPSMEHWKFVKHIMRYVSATSSVGLVYKCTNQFNIKFFSDSDFASDTVSSKSTTGNITIINGTPVQWVSSRQGPISLSSTEAEIIALTTCAKNAIHFTALLNGLEIKNDLPAKIYGDNSSANLIVTNNINSSRTKHMSVKYNFIKDHIESKRITIIKVHTAENLADFLTKALSHVKLNSLMNIINIKRLHD